VQKLVRGIHEFQVNYFATNRALFQELAARQQPETLFITCSDSRVIPELITSAAPGDLFIVRNVGNVVPDYQSGVKGGVAAAIQYAVEFLNVQNIIVCGHTGCGAIEAILNPERLADLDLVRRWLEQTDTIRAIIARQYPHLDGAARSTAAVEENVLVQLENLRTYPFIERRLQSKELRLSGWVFQIASGEVYEYDPQAHEFTLLVSDAVDAQPPR
jgi:carbonic anhydrase